MEMNNISALPKVECTGCGSCYNCCPVDAIQMKPDKRGFLFPVVLSKRCINCSQCVSACPILTKEVPCQQKEPVCYAAWSKNEAVRFCSTSGGVFTHLAEAILDQGGLVAGARYRQDHLVEHTLIQSKNNIEQLRQSKYVQSETGLVFRQIKEALISGKPVLFVGTPCQCAGLRSYLGKSYEKLYQCDFICRGVNAPAVYLAYLKKLEDQYKSPVKQIWFKNKTFGWNNFCTKIIFEDGQVYLADRETDPYMLGYIKSKLSCYMRDCCYDCKFKGISRHTDITLGDFWGIKNIPNLENGVSVVLLHTEKANSFFFYLSDIEYQEKNLQDVLPSNVCIQRSVWIADKLKYSWEEL